MTAFGGTGIGQFVNDGFTGVQDARAWNCNCFCECLVKFAVAGNHLVFGINPW